MMFLYDKDLAPIGPVSHALRIGYEEKLNNLTTAQLVLPSNDEVVDDIVVPASFARIYDGEEDLGYFRFYKIPRDEHAPQGEILYELQSAQCTLLDDTLDGWHEIGGTGIDTRQVIEYILARQSKNGVQRWVLGRCDFQAYFQYNFQDVTLLEAIMSLGEVLLEPFRFVFDSTAVPWTMHLIRESDDVIRQLTYNRNMTRIRRSIDGRVVTRLRGRGYGEGDNQLTIASVNGGLDYIDADDASMRKWGVRCGTHVDTRQTDPALLKAHMEQILIAGKQPTVSYEADAIDLWRQTGEDWDHIGVGSRVLVLDETLHESVSARVTGRKKHDVGGDPGSVAYTLDNSVADTAEELNEIRDKIGVHELYSQGATNMYSMQIADNADTAHPLVMRFYVPGNVLRINSCLMTWEIESFRTYITMAKAGGGGTRTSKEGGGATVTLPERTLRVTQVSAGATDTDGGTVDKTSVPVNSSGATVTSTGSSGVLTSDFSMNANGMMTQTGKSESLTTEGSGILTSDFSENANGMMTQTGEDGVHDHAVNRHTHSVSIGLPGHGHKLTDSTSQTGGLVSTPDISGTTGERAPGTSEDGAHSHAMTHYHKIQSHSHSIPDHSHAMTHYHQIQGHTHSLDHVHDMTHIHSITHEHIIPSMSFKLEAHSHTVELPEHEHEVKYGVYEGAKAGSVVLRVDGNDVPAEAIGENRELDIAPYLGKDSAGKVTRGTFHKVEFVPDGLTRLTANLFFQVFIQSRGAGDY